MPADREEAQVREPRNDDGTGHEPEQVAGGADEDKLERAHGIRCVGQAVFIDPARREWRRGGRPCTTSVCGAVSVASSEGPYACDAKHVRYRSTTLRRGPCVGRVHGARPKR